MAYTTQQLKESIERLYGDIDECITDLIRARLNKDAEGEGKALFTMEGLMVATVQELTYIEDFIDKQRQEFIECIPRLYMNWILADADWEKPTFEEYANKIWEERKTEYGMERL